MSLMQYLHTRALLVTSFTLLLLLRILQWTGLERHLTGLYDVIWMKAAQACLSASALIRESYTQRSQNTTGIKSKPS